MDAVAEDGEQTKSRIKIVGDAHEHRCVVDYFLLTALDKEHHHIVGKRIDNEHGEHEIDKHNADGVLHATAHAIELSRSDVLSAVGGHGYANILENTGEEIFDTHGSRKEISL